MTNCEQFRTKCCAIIAATLTLATAYVFLLTMDKNVITGVLKYIFSSENELKFCDVMSLLLKICIVFGLFVCLLLCEGVCVMVWGCLGGGV